MAITTLIRGSSQIISGSILDAQISSTASIQESKLLFNTTTGHDHDGTNSRVINKSNFSSHLIYNEIPTGTINGTNTTFVLANIPIVSSGVNASISVRLNGLILQPGTANTDKDIFINGNATITTTFIPASGDLILVDYAK